MNATLQTVGRQTAISIGLALIIVGATWAIATDRQEAVSQIDRNAEAIERHELTLTELEHQLDYLTQAMVRIESKLGTLPPRSRHEYADEP